MTLMQFCGLLVVWLLSTLFIATATWFEFRRVRFNFNVFFSLLFLLTFFFGFPLTSILVFRFDVAVAPPEILAMGKLVHHHSVARPQRLAEGCGHSVNGENKQADDHDKKRGHRKSDEEFYYLMLSTHLNRRFQRTPEKPLRSGSELHQMKIGLPTT